MGEHETLSQAGGLLLNGLLPNKTSHVTRVLNAERWSKVEERGAELLACIQPNRQSEEHRNVVTNYVQTLIKKGFSCEVGHLINKNHIFKRSIILIKAWCYYESRILGARFGLISTYTLEILVLYIFHVFNNSFAGPFEVLYRFLEVFSNFDWKHFCVSLWGPVPINSLPDTTVVLPRKDGGKLLFYKAFIETFRTAYVVSLSGHKNQGQQFIPKHLNVIDPLRTNNNLGRSVSKANFYRIRSAFAFGAKKLDALLDCPKENLIAEVDWFFQNTWERHRSGN